MPRAARTSPRRAPRQKRAEDTVTALLDATEIVFAARGFKGTTTNRIASKAGVSIGTLYHYFPSTEALIEAVVHRMWARELHAMQDSAELFATAPLAVAIEATVRGLVTVMADRRALYQRWYAEASHLGKLGTGLELTEQAVALVRAAFHARSAELSVKDLDFAADLAVKAALAVVRTGARDYPKETESGALTRELSLMLSRWLLAR